MEKNQQDKTQKIIRLGICAMEKKVYSKHMQHILNGLRQYSEISIIIFDESIIFGKQIEEWPIVDALIIFFSDGFPYKKGLQYVNYRNPFLINDFEMQKVFWDRRKVLSILKKEKISIPKHIIVDRGEVIDNDGEKINSLNKSAEIEKKIKSFHDELERMNEIYEDEKIGNNDKKKESEDEKNSKKKNKNPSIQNQKKTEEKNEINDKTNIKTEEEKEKKTKIKILQNPNIKHQNSKDDLIEYDDHIEYKTQKLYKPFVEKPANGDDHFVYIYYPPNHGGGSKRLFRKTKDECSLFFSKINDIRRDQSYIYEEFLQTDGFDIKVYTIGPEYAHAEARKSPTLDGKVQRSSDGKEIRYPINLTPQEKDFARKIVKIFKQNICGFDILRSNGKSYVCDVNGWSFVKGNKKYYEDCAILIRRMVLQKLDMKLFLEKPVYLKKRPVYKNLEIPSGNNNKKYEEELRSVVAVFRHGDRSPKQKMKIVVEDKDILSLFDIYGNSDDVILNKGEVYKQKEIKLKKPNELMTVLKLVTKILSNNKIDGSNINHVNDDFFTKLFQIKMVLEKNINFEGMTRKIQLKPLDYSEEINPKTKKIKYKIIKALLILKWGGTLTHSGIEQGKLLGNTFRFQIYPSSLGDGTGIVRLHNTYRHDLKCYSAEEGRCLKTAASFLKGLLQFQDPITPIITSMIRRDKNITDALDVTNEQIPEVKGKIKHEISECLNFDGDLESKFEKMFDIKSIYPDFDYSLKEKFKDNKSNIDKNKNDNNNNNDNIDNNKNENKNNNDNNNENIKNINDFYWKFPIYDIMRKIKNPVKKMKLILNQLDKFLEHLKIVLSKEEEDEDLDTYFITNISSIKKRTSFLLENSKLLNSLNEEKNNNLKNEKEPEQNQKILKSNSFKGTKSSLSHRTISSCESGENKKEKLITSELKKKKKFKIPECQEEKEILIYKRYKKLRSDFFNEKTQKFEITKIPDIYDNIKYDIIHNKYILNENAYSLYENIILIANFLLPFEYGITIKEKINIGLKIIEPLMNKIYKDLIWWNYNNPYFESKNDMNENDESWSGLDQSRVDSSDIKSAWRHVKTRFYFTCASHMYALINLLVYGYNSFLLGDNKETLYELRNIFDLDYCSHVIFRLYENFNVSLEDKKRFRLEIFMSPGTNKDPKTADQKHLINLSSWIILNNNLNFPQMKEFFSQFIGIDG